MADKSINVALLTSYANSDAYIGAVRVDAVKKVLEENGHRCTVHTTDPTSEARDIQKHADMVNKLSERVRFLATPLKALRKIWYLLFGINLHPLYRGLIEAVSREHRSRPFDVIFATSPQPEMLEAAGRVSTVTGVPLVSDLRDGILFEPLKKPNIIEAVINRRIEKSLVEHSAAVVAVSNHLCNYFINEYGYDKRSAFAISNGFELEKHDQSRQTLTANVLDAKYINIVFTGRIALSTPDLLVSIQALEQAITSIPDQTRARLRFHFFGEFTEQERRQMGRYAVLHDKRPRLDILAIQQSADYLLILGGTRSATVPGKMYEYLAANRPVLAITPSGGALAQLVNNTNSGVCIDNDNTPGLAKELMALEKNPACVTGNITQYDWEVLGKRMLDVLYFASRRSNH